MAMTGQDWLAYWQAKGGGEDEKRKADWLDLAGTGLGAGAGLVLGGPAGAMAGAQLGGAVGGAAENAVNHTLTPGNVLGAAQQAVGGYGGMTDAMDTAQGKSLVQQLADAGFFAGFAAGGAVPDPNNDMWMQAALGGGQPTAQAGGPAVGSPDDVVEFMRGIEDGMKAMPGDMSFTPEQPKHPTLEMLANVVPQVVKALPAPRQTNSVNKTIGSWAPALATAFSAPINYAKDQREARNKAGSEAAKALADHRWSLAREVVSRVGVGGDKSRAVGEMEQPVSADALKAIGAPSWVKTQRDLNTYQEERRRVEDAARRSGEAAQKAADKADAEAMQEADDDRYAQLVASFKENPKVPMTGRTALHAQSLRLKIDEALKGTGYSRGELEQLWDEADRFSKTGNSQRFAALRASAQTFAAHLRSLRSFYETFDSKYRAAKKEAQKNPLKFGNIPKLNAGLFSAAQAGLLGDDAASQAAAIAPFFDVVQNELPLVLASGYAPQKEQYDEAKKLLSAKLGPGANAARLKSLEEVVDQRLEVYKHMTAFQRGRNGKFNPYTLDVNPLEGWDSAKPLVESRDESAAGQWKRQSGGK